MALVLTAIIEFQPYDSQHLHEYFHLYHWDRLLSRNTAVSPTSCWATVLRRELFFVVFKNASKSANTLCRYSFIGPEDIELP